MNPESNDQTASQVAAPAEPAPLSTGYPVTVTFEMPGRQSRGLALISIIALRLVLLIPHLIILYILQIVALVVAWLNMWCTLFTGHSSPGMHRFVSGTLRWSTRVSSYMYGLHDKYPPFGLS